MRDLFVLLVHLLATVARPLGPGGPRTVIAETLLMKHQLLIMNRARRRAPNLTAMDRIVMGLPVVRGSDKDPQGRGGLKARDLAGFSPSAHHA